MTELSYGFKKALSRLVLHNDFTFIPTSDSTIEIAGYREVTLNGGWASCETCSYEYDAVVIDYLFNGKPRQYEYTGDFASLVKELTDE